MALTPYYTQTTKPVGETSGGQVTQNTLARWRNRQKQAQGHFSAGQRP